MDLPTQSHLKTLRDALEYRLGELSDEVQHTEAARRAPVDATEVDDLEEEAQRFEAGDIAEAEEQRDVDELRLVQGALSRLDDGIYGDCAECGRPIGLQRLFAQPAAERCARCQTAFEERHRRHALH
jgi:RNA polymerase-binding transcription factor DksA